MTKKTNLILLLVLSPIFSKHGSVNSIFISLAVVDVYAEWCGPCSSMSGHLRRIKLELGDDYLTLAVVGKLYIG